jgi:hypothetical protein
VAAVQVPINGAGQLANGLGADPGQVVFATVIGVGQSSAAQTVTVTNSAGYAIGALSLAVTAPFVLAQNNCTGSLAANANCTAAVMFSPTAAGAATGTLTVSSAVVAAPATVPLSGTGFDFSLNVSGAGGVTVSSGQTADFPIAITPSGPQESFSFACGALPANAACTFNPSSLSLNPGVEGNVTAEIATGESSAAARVQSETGALPLACGLLLLPLALLRRRRMFLLAVLAAVLAAGVTSCTSSSGGTGGNPKGDGSSTPAGTYTIPITVTSTGVSHTVNVTLTVD